MQLCDYFLSTFRLPFADFVVNFGVRFGCPVKRLICIWWIAGCLAASVNEWMNGWMDGWLWQRVCVARILLLHGRTLCCCTQHTPPLLCDQSVVEVSLMRHAVLMLSSNIDDIVYFGMCNGTWNETEGVLQLDWYLWNLKQFALCLKVIPVFHCVMYLIFKLKNLLEFLHQINVGLAWNQANFLTATNTTWEASLKLL